MANQSWPPRGLHSEKQQGAAFPSHAQRFTSHAEGNHLPWADASERILSTVSGRRKNLQANFFKGNPPGGREGRACGTPLRRQGRRTEEAGSFGFHRIFGERA